MKPQYEYTDDWRSFKQYSLRYVYDRRPKTMNEYRQNRCAIADGHKVRGRRRILPTTWDDLPPSFGYGRCWKRFTKQKKQWDRTLSGTAARLSI